MLWPSILLCISTSLLLKLPSGRTPSWVSKWIKAEKRKTCEESKESLLDGTSQCLLYHRMFSYRCHHLLFLTQCSPKSEFYELGILHKSRPTQTSSWKQWVSWTERCVQFTKCSLQGALTQMCLPIGKPPNPSRDPFHTPFSGKASVEFGLTKKASKSFTETGSERGYCKPANILVWN